MSDTEQKVDHDKSVAVDCSLLFQTCAQNLLDAIQSTESNQSVDHKAAERSRLYRERHREQINQRRRDIRQRKKKLQPIYTPSYIQNINGIELTSNNEQSSNSHSQRQHRYYQRHKEEINKRKRESRLNQNTVQTNPATAAERNRKYRERNRQKINERRRYRRLHQQNVQKTNKECHINNTDSSEYVTKAPSNEQKIELAQNFTSTLQHDSQHFEETHNVSVPTTSTFQTVEVSECKEKWKNLRYSFVRSLKPNSDGSLKKKYYLHNEMEFVIPHLKLTSKAMESTSLEYESYEENTDSNQEDVLSTVQEPHYAECIETPQLSEPPKKKIKSSHTVTNNQVQTTYIPGRKEEDFRKMFLLSLLPEVTELTELQMRSFRRGVLNLLDDISQRGTESTILSWESNTDTHHNDLVKKEPL